MIKEIHVIIKSVYGKRRIYPNCNHAVQLLKLMNDKAKTVPEDKLELIKVLGYKVIVDQINEKTKPEGI